MGDRELTEAEARASDIFDPARIGRFICGSVSEQTRSAYVRTVCDFFQFIGGVHPAQVTPAMVQSYCDYLRIEKKRKANTIATKLAFIRSFFERLKIGGVIHHNPASTKSVVLPPLPSVPQGRALTLQEVRNLLAGPDRSKVAGARDYALMLLMLRLGLRLAEVSALRVSSIEWRHGRWTLQCRTKDGQKQMWPLPKEVKRAIDDYLELDAPRRRALRTNGKDAYLFQPLVNYRTLQFNKPLSARMIQQIVGQWGELTGVGKVRPHDLRQTVIMKLLDDGYDYREVQMVTKHKDAKTIMRYDQAREKLRRVPHKDLDDDEQPVRQRHPFERSCDE